MPTPNIPEGGVHERFVKASELNAAWRKVLVDSGFIKSYVALGVVEKRVMEVLEEKKSDE